MYAQFLTSLWLVLEPSKFDLKSSFVVISLQEGATAERVCKILESSLRSPHVPLQVNNFVICYLGNSARVIHIIAGDWLTRYQIFTRKVENKQIPFL